MNDKHFSLINTAREESLPTISQMKINNESVLGPSVTTKQDILIKENQKIVLSKRKAKPKNNILSKFKKI